MPLHVLGIAGSLRSGSFNRLLLNAASALLPEGMTMELADLAPIPLYNGDLEAKALPDTVRSFRERIRAADALLIATPEYNYSIPGVLKNAIDWASRQPDPPLSGKPTAIMGASTGLYGTVRAQMHLRHVAVVTNVLLLNRPEVLVARAQEKFGPEGDLRDEKTIEAVRKLMFALKEWTLLVRP